MLRLKIILVFTLGFTLGIALIAGIYIYAFYEMQYGVGKGLVVLGSLLLISVGAVLVSVGYGFGVAVFKISIQPLYSFILGFVFATITIGVVLTTKALAPRVPLLLPLISLLFPGVGGFSTAGIISWFSRRGRK